MKNTSQKKVERLLDFICEDQGLSDGQIKNDLIADGVNVERFLARVQQTVRLGMQARIRENIVQQQEAQPGKHHAIIKDIAYWPRNKCLEFIETIRNGGACCDIGQQRVAIAFRNKQQDQEASDDELRSCIKDILSLRDNDEN